MVLTSIYVRGYHFKEAQRQEEERYLRRGDMSELANLMTPSIVEGLSIRLGGTGGGGRILS